MDKVLFVTEKWCDGKKESGETNSRHNLIGSFTSFADQHKCFNYDDFYIEKQQPADEELLKVCEEFAPDFVIATYLFHDLKYDPNIKIETWNKIKVPKIFIWFDLSLPFVAETADYLESCSDLNVVLDTSDFNVKNPKKFINLWTPQDERYFFDPKRERDVDVCFVGSIKDYADRNIALHTLQKRGINVFQIGGQRECSVPFEGYSSIMQRSKISLSFPFYRGTPLIQAKGRIFESTLCGCLLIDVDNKQTKNWFIPDEDYVSVKTISELEEKIEYYLKNDDQRIKIANSGNKKSVEKYNAKNFWNTIFERVKNER